MSFLSTTYAPKIVEEDIKIYKILIKGKDGKLYSRGQRMEYELGKVYTKDTSNLDPPLPIAVNDRILYVVPDKDYYRAHLQPIKWLKYKTYTVYDNEVLTIGIIPAGSIYYEYNEWATHQAASTSIKIIKILCE